MQGQGQGFSLDAIRRIVEDKVCEAVESVVSRIPNGHQYRDQFRQAIGGAMDHLQQQAHSQMGGLGGMMGNLGMGQRTDQPPSGNPPIH